MKRFGILVLALLTGVGAFASDVVGTEIVDKGTLRSLEGTLKEIDEEWYLVSGGVTYQVHLGNGTYLESTGIRLKVGAKATVQGFFLKNDIAVTTVTMDGKTYTFRDQDGRPRWAGNGRGSFEGTGRGTGGTGGTQGRNSDLPPGNKA